jgi:hypothetical protein
VLAGGVSLLDQRLHMAG